MIQRVYSGFQSINNLKSIIKEYNAQKVFLITGKHSFDASGARKIIERILVNSNYYRFYDFKVNPSLNDVEKGIDRIKKDNFDITIAIGGGSVIDMAKLISLFVEQPDKPIDYIKKIKPIQNPGKPLVAIPTTAGSGSEATHFAVVYINKTKYSVAHESVLPKMAIIDPFFTMSLSKTQTAITGMDAFSQAVESYWSVNSTAESKNFSSQAINLILKNIYTSVFHPTKKSRAAMANAAHLAGKAINISKTTAAHAFSYPLTSFFKIPHGHAVSLTLGEILLYNSLVSEKDIADKRGVTYVQNTIHELNYILGCSNSESSSNKISDLMQKIGLETNLSKLGINSEQIGIIVNSVNPERLAKNPRLFTKESLENVLSKII